MSRERVRQICLVIGIDPPRGRPPMLRRARDMCRRCQRRIENRRGNQWVCDACRFAPPSRPRPKCNDCGKLGYPRSLCLFNPTTYRCMACHRAYWNPRQNRPERSSNPRRIRASVRFLVLEQYGFRCRYCGKGAEEGAILEIEHLTPVSAGGTNARENLVPACRTCNMGKFTRSVEAQTPQPIDRGVVL